MIRINLLKSPKSRKREKLTIPPKAFVIGGVAVGLIVLIIAAVVVVNSIANRPKPAPTMAKSELPPSSFVKARIVEEVVRDINVERDKLSQTGYLALPYDQLSLPEKINYEGLFAKDVCDMLVRVVPEEIGLRSLEITNYSTVYAVGLSTGRELVNDLFSSLKNENVTLMPKPLSFIKPNESGGYKFAFTCETQWGLRISDPYVDLSLSDLPLRSGLAPTMKQFEKIAKDSKISIKGKGTRLAASKDGEYRRFQYRYNATGTFVDHVAFLTGLYDARIPCAFKSTAITAQSSKKVSIDMVVVFTTKE